MNSPAIVRHTRLAAYGLVRDQERLLMCRISSQIPRWAGYWTLPGGGVEFGEHPEAAVVREVMEETGITVKVDALATVDSVFRNVEPAPFHGVRILYHTTLLGGELRFEAQGTTDQCAWWTREQLGSMKMVELARVGIDWAYAR